ncbi:MAG: hypothetical protein L0Z50_35370 [Verrucomicrobiales bacterium]|nr:hypothetical protein [Verrucomicrobiales bacterium]
MNANRSTDGESALRWLNIVQRGGTRDWEALYRACTNIEVARQVAVSLTNRDPDLLPSARLWKFLIEDLHPELKIDLHEEDVNIGV